MLIFYLIFYFSSITLKSQVPFKVLHHFHDAYVTSISHVKRNCSSITLWSSQVQLKVLHHFHDAYVTSISHVKRNCSSIILWSSQVQFKVLHHFHDVYVIYLPCFNKTFIHHKYNHKCHSKDYITFYDVDVHLSFMF